MIQNFQDFFTHDAVHMSIYSFMTKENTLGKWELSNRFTRRSLCCTVAGPERHLARLPAQNKPLAHCLLRMVTNAHDKYSETIRLCLCHVNGINTWKYENGKKTCFQIVRVRGKGILWKIIVWTDIFHSFWDKGPWIPRPQILSRNIVFK